MAQARLNGVVPSWSHLGCAMLGSARIGSAPFDGLGYASLEYALLQLALLFRNELGSAGIDLADLGSARWNSTSFCRPQLELAGYSWAWLS